jgi:hypothetical protein
MAEISKFFNSAPGDPRTYQASDFADYFGSILSTGLLHTDNIPALEVKCDGNDLRTYVTPGKAIIQGYLYENTSNLYLDHALPEPALDRIDRIVLRLDKRNQSRFIKLFVKQGVPSSNPVPPDLQRDDFIYELSLAQIRVRANTSTLNPADLIDERLDENLCGLVHSLISIPTSQFQAQWDLYFNAKKGEIDAETLAYEQELANKLIQYENDFNAWFADIQDTGFASSTDFNAHKADTTKHVTQNEKDTWNNKVSKSGDTMTGNLKIKKDVPLLELENSTGTKKATIMLNASATADYGIKIQKDGTDVLLIENDKTIKFKDSNGNWDTLANLKSYVSNGKIQVRDAITGKGGNVADADGDGIPTFTELANAINSLQTFQNGFTTPSKSSVEYYAQDKNGVIYAYDYWNTSNRKLKKLNSNGALLASYDIGYDIALFYSEDGFVKEVGGKFQLYTEQKVLIKELFSSSVLNNESYNFIGYRNDGYIVARYQAGTSASYVRVYNEAGVKLTETSWTGGSLASFVSKAFLNKNRTLVLVCSDGYGEIDEIWRIPKDTYSISRYSFDIPDIFYNDFTTI